MPDPTTTHSLTTAAAPEWAAEATGDARDAEIARLKRELADVKAECCRLTCRNGDLEAENERLKRELGTAEDTCGDMFARARDVLSASMRLGRWARAIVAKHDLKNADGMTVKQYLGPEIRGLRTALAAMDKAEEAQ